MSCIVKKAPDKLMICIDGKMVDLMPSIIQNYKDSLIAGPTASNESFDGTYDQTVVFSMVENDLPGDGALDLSTLEVTQPAVGTVTINPDGTFGYTPQPGFTGTDTFVYQICDVNGLCDTATITITIPVESNLVTVKTLASENSTPSEGDVVTFEIEVTNGGPQEATGVSLTDLLPADLVATVNNGTATQGSYNAVTGLWDVGTLANGASATLTIEGVVGVDFEGTITNVTTAAVGNETDPDTVGDDLEEAVEVYAPSPARVTTVDDDTLANVTIGYAGSTRCDGSPATPDDCYKTDWFVEHADHVRDFSIDGSTVPTSRVVHGIRTLVASIEECPAAGTFTFDWSDSFITEPAVQQLIEAEFGGSMSYNKATIDDYMKGVTTYASGNANGNNDYDHQGAPIPRPESSPTAGGGTDDTIVAGTTGVDYLDGLGFPRIVDYGDEVFREGAEHVFVGTLVEGSTGTCPGTESSASNEVYVKKGMKRIKTNPTYVGENENDSPNFNHTARIQDTQFGVNAYAWADHFNNSTRIQNGILWHNVDNSNPVSWIDFGLGNGQTTWLADTLLGQVGPQGDTVVSHEAVMNNGMVSTNERWSSVERAERSALNGKFISLRNGPRVLNVRVWSDETRLVFEENTIPDITADAARFALIKTTAQISEAGGGLTNAVDDTATANHFIIPERIDINQRFVHTQTAEMQVDPDRTLTSTHEVWIVETF